MALKVQQKNSSYVNYKTRYCSRNSRATRHNSPWLIPVLSVMYYIQLYTRAVQLFKFFTLVQHEAFSFSH